MDRAKKLVTIRDTDQESAFGYVFSVSGPGTTLRPLASNLSRCC
jgi:hypothetical protein